MCRPAGAAPQRRGSRSIRTRSDPPATPATASAARAVKPISQQPLAAHRQLQPGPLAVDRHPDDARRASSSAPRRSSAAMRDRVAPGRRPPAPARGGRSWRSRHAGAVQPHAERRAAAVDRERQVGVVGQGGRHRDQRELGARGARAEHVRDGGAGVQGASAAPPVGAGGPDVARRPAQDRVDRRGARGRGSPGAAARSSPRRGAPPSMCRSGSPRLPRACSTRPRPRGRRGPACASRPATPSRRRRALAAREARDLPAGAHGPHREALGVDGRRRHAAPGVPGGEDRHDPELRASAG